MCGSDQSNENSKAPNFNKNSAEHKIRKIPSSKRHKNKKSNFNERLQKEVKDSRVVIIIK